MKRVLMRELFDITREQSLNSLCHRASDTAKPTIGLTANLEIVESDAIRIGLQSILIGELSPCGIDMTDDSLPVDDGHTRRIGIDD